MNRKNFRHIVSFLRFLEFFRFKERNYILFLTTGIGEAHAKLPPPGQKLPKISGFSQQRRVFSKKFIVGLEKQR